MADVGPGHAHTLTDLILIQIAFFLKAGQGQTDFDGVEVLPLEVFNQGHFDHALLTCIHHISRNLGHLEQSCRPQSSLTGDQLIGTGSHSAYRQRLNNPQMFNGLFELIQRLLIKLIPGLEGIDFDLFQGDESFADSLLEYFLILGRQEGVQASA